MNEQKKYERPTKHVLIWKEIHAVLNDFCGRVDYSMSDLVSSLVIEACRNEGITFSALIKWGKIKVKEAEELALQLKVEIEKAILLLKKKEEEEWEGGQ